MENSCYKTVLLLAVMVIAFIKPTAAWAQPGPIKYRVRTSCLTEIRGGKKSCWGIVINFDDARFKKSVQPSQLKIFEAKHGSNIIKLMTWRVSEDRKQLTIKFKRGTGDFGTGNQAGITLYKTAFTVPPNAFPEYVVFVQKTDIN
jgi:hypothetical protein